jgi:hypothetical protein
MCKTLTLAVIGVLLSLASCSKVTTETRKRVTNGEFSIIVDSKEFNHSGSAVIDICVAGAHDPNIGRPKQQCFFTGYDLGELSASWLSRDHISIRYASGRVTHFTNSAFVYSGSSPVPSEFRISLSDSLPN